MTSEANAQGHTAFALFGARVAEDEGLQNRLAGIEDPESFVKRAAASAAALGIALAPETIATAISPDPLGLTRWTAAAVAGTAWPKGPWLPVHVLRLADRVYIDLAHFGFTGLNDPFFEGSARRALNRPFNQLFRYRMALEDFIANAPLVPAAPPSGFIFHMSRCGSTLIAQMLGALSGTTVISEAPPIDAAVQLELHPPAGAPAQGHGLLTAMIAAYGRAPNGGDGRRFFKLDSWHALALPLFRRVFPDVPWVFVYRDPIEVLVSQMRQRGMQMVPELIAPSVYGIEGAECLPDEDYCARVLGRICAAVPAPYRAGGGLLVNYCDLPDAVWSQILPHFGMACSEVERAALADVARYDAKTPGAPFNQDGDAKKCEASAALRQTARQHVSECYRTLEELRRSAPER